MFVNNSVNSDSCFTSLQLWFSCLPPLYQMFFPPAHPGLTLDLLPSWPWA